MEHTQALMETLIDAKRRKHKITVCWLDLANAYGSVSHNLIQFAAKWYHVPDTLREMIFNYYDDMAVQIVTATWKTETISYEKLQKKLLKSYKKI